MFHTLLDYTANAKEWSYILAGVILLGFAFFWVFLNKNVTRKKK